MGKTMGRFLKMLAINGFFSVMYYLWQLEGVEQAGNVFLFLLWFFGIAGMLIGMFLPPDAKLHRGNHPTHLAVARLCSLAILVGAVWAGHPIAATFYLLGVCGVHAYSEKSKALAQEAA